jgi:hypothetical protein
MAQRVRNELASQQGNARSLYVLTRMVQTMAHYPREWLADKSARLRNIWQPFNLDARVIRLDEADLPWSVWLLPLTSYSVVALLLLGTLGMVIARDDASKLLIAMYILYSLLIFLLTHYLPRFRLPLLVLLMPYAAFGLVGLLAWLRAPSLHVFRRHPARTLAAAVVLALFVVLTLL